MDKIVLVTDRTELTDTFRRALRGGPVFQTLTPDQWRRGEFGTSRDRLFLLDLPTHRSIRERLSVAENWPHGFAGSLLIILAPELVKDFRPSLVISGLIVEPFSDEEAALRVRFLLWKERAESATDVLTYGDLSIDTESYEVSVGGRLLDLTFKEYELLRFLVSHPGRVFTRDLLLSRVWGEDYYGGTRTVDVHVRRLRLKLGVEHDAMIQTVRNVGYRFHPLPEADNLPKPSA